MKKLCQIALLSLFLSSLSWAAKSQNAFDANQLIHILDYLSKDYSAAVVNGQVVNEDEYAEMQNFSQLIQAYINDNEILQQNAVYQNCADSIGYFIKTKATQEDLAKYCNLFVGTLVKELDLSLQPKSWPQYAHALTSYQDNCASCHGVNGHGDGPLAKTLNPTPTNFYDRERMRSFSAFQVYNTIKNGVEGTGMAAYNQLSEQEAWELAFYVLQLPYQGKSKGENQLNVSLKDVSELNENQLIEKYKPLHPEVFIADLRTFQESEKSNNQYITHALHLLDSCYLQYKNGNKQAARNFALASYMNGIEPIEVQINIHDKNQTKRLERKMLALRNAIEANESIDHVAALVEENRQEIHDAQSLLNNHKKSFWLNLFMAFSIITREALESVLIIAIISSIIYATGNKKAMLHMHLGWIAAVLLGVALWFLSGLLMKIDMSHVELFEAITAIISIILVLYMGFWMHSHSESVKWRQFVEGKMKKLMSEGNLLGLSFLSFIIVGREVLESVLFLRALTIDQSSNSSLAVLLGFLSAFVLTIAFYFVFRSFSLKMPISKILKLSSWVMIVLAVIFTGKATHSLQEAGLIHITPIPHLPTIDMLGVYPSVQTLLSQIIMAVFIALLFKMGNRKRTISNLAK